MSSPRTSSARRIVRRLRRELADRRRGSGVGPSQRHQVPLAHAAGIGTMGPDDRLVPSPVFLLSSMRSGSTLLRSLLANHPEIAAPHEMHLGELRLAQRTSGVAKSQDALGVSETDLLDLLWDRVLHRELLKSGRSVIVDKTPKNTFEWRRIRRAWPQARYIILLRHPEQIFQSLLASRPDQGAEKHYSTVNRYAGALDNARRGLDAVVVRYEDLTADPAGETKRICDYLGLAWDESMLDYGAANIDYRRGLGDWSSNIRSGKVQAAAPLPSPADVPAELRDACALLGY